MQDRAGNLVLDMPAKRHHLLRRVAEHDGTSYPTTCRSDRSATPSWMLRSHLLARPQHQTRLSQQLISDQRRSHELVPAACGAGVSRRVVLVTCTLEMATGETHVRLTHAQANKLHFTHPHAPTRAHPHTTHTQRRVCSFTSASRSRGTLAFTTMSPYDISSDYRTNQHSVQQFCLLAGR